MAISSAERRFLRLWEEQRQDGKWSYTATFTFGLTLVIFLSSVALGLFMSLPFVKTGWLITMGIGSVVGGFLLSLMLWSRNQKRFRRIIQREING